MPTLYLLSPNEDDLAPLAEVSDDELPEGITRDIGKNVAFSKQTDSLNRARELRQLGIGSTIYKAETAKLGSRDLMAALFNNALDDAFEGLEEFKTFEGVS